MSLLVSITAAVTFNPCLWSGRAKGEATIFKLPVRYQNSADHSRVIKLTWMTPEVVWKDNATLILICMGEQTKTSLPMIYRCQKISLSHLYLSNICLFIWLMYCITHSPPQWSEISHCFVIIATCWVCAVWAKFVTLMLLFCFQMIWLIVCANSRYLWHKAKPSNPKLTATWFRFIKKRYFELEKELECF